MPKYFKFIGTIELIFTIIGFFYFAFNLSELQSIIPIGGSNASSEFTFFGFLTLFIYAIFAPAFGLFLIAFGEILERVRETRNALNLSSQQETEEHPDL